MVAQDRGVTLEDAAFLRLLDMLVQRDDALGLVEACQLIHQVQKRLVMRGLELGPFHDLPQPAQRRAQHRRRVGDHEGAYGPAPDHHPLIGQCIEHDVHFAARQHEAAENQPENHCKPKKDRHALPAINTQSRVQPVALCQYLFFPYN